MATLRFLLLEDKLRDIEAIQLALTGGGIDYKLLRVDTRAAFVRALETDGFDLILAAYAMPGLDGMTALELACGLCPDVPFIFVSTTLGEERAIETLKRGATDYVLKQRLERLVPCVQRAVREAQERRERQWAERLLLEQKQLLELIASGRSLDECLSAVCGTIAQLKPHVRAAFLLADAQRQSFPHAITPDFPPTFGQGLKDAPMNDLCIDTCGEAVSRGQPISCADIAHDDRWSQDWRDLCVAHGVLACHSTPVLGADGLPLGALLLAFDEARLPTDWEYQLADFGVQVASLAFERDRVHAALRESEAKYRTLFESIDEGFCIVEVLFEADGTATDHRILQANAAFERHTGILDPIGKTASELAPGLEQYWNDLYAQVLHTGETVRLENRSDALNRWFDVLVWRVDDGSTCQVAIVFTDITERKQIETALQESEAQLRLALKTGKLGSWQLDLKTNQLFTSDQCKANYSFAPEADFTHQALLDRIHPDDRAWVQGAIDQAIEQQTDYDVEYRTVWDDGSTHWALVRGCTVYGADGTPLQMVGMSLDTTDRKQVEQALRESEEQSRNILESITEAFFALDENWLFTYANGAAETLLGRSPGDLIGKNLWEEYPGLAGNELEQVYRLAMFARTAESMTAFYPDHDRWYEVHTYPATNGVTAYFRNVTAQIQAEEAVRLSESRFRRIFDCNMIGMGIWTRSGGIAESNDALLDIIGYTRQDLNEGRLNWQEITPLEYAEFDQRAIVEIGQRGVCSPYEKDFLHRQGQRVPILIGAAGFADNPEAGFFFAVDLTDRKQVEADLRESEERFRTLADQMSQFAWMADANGWIFWYNRRWFDYTGTTLEEMQGWGWQQVHHPEHVDRVVEHFRHCLEAGEQWEDTFPLRSKDGTYGWFLSRAVPVRDAAGNISLWFGTNTDITERLQAEQEREQLLEREQTAREEAECANRLKDEFLAVLSHELRSPLNPILGWSRLLQNGTLDETRRAEALQTIERNAKLQAQLIEDLLDISRIMQGKLSLTAAPVSLTFVITAAVETVRLAAEAKQIQLTLDLPTIAPISGDAARLQQVVWNLLTNAVKFTPNGGQVTVELMQLDQMAQLCVIDTGKGIDPQFLPHVFEYFRQEDGSTTRRFGGLGLGLAIVRQIVEMHGGTVWAESEGENQGATFIVQLPTMPQAALVPEPIRTQAETAAPLDTRQILLVDDDTDTREFQTFLLEQNGATVTAVASGLAALQALEQLTPDVIVSDVGMADMDGYMLMQQIRSRSADRGRTIPAIALTAYAAELDQQKAFQAGFQAHITKPVEPEALVQAIVQLLQKNKGNKL